MDQIKRLAPETLSGEEEVQENKQGGDKKTVDNETVQISKRV